MDPDALISFAEENKVVVQMERSVGDFVIKGAPIASVYSYDDTEADYTRALNSLYTVNSYRTVDEDAGFGIRQLVDIALKALSPGVNDTTTALICVDYLGSILHCLVGRKIPPRRRYSKGELRVVASGPTFKSLVDESFSEIAQSAKGNPAVLLRILRAIQTVAAKARNDARRRVLGLITRIGFIGGGAILKEGANVRGTTTAASIWKTGAIGAAVAYGRYEIAIVLAIINFITFRWLTPLKKGMNKGVKRM